MLRSNLLAIVVGCTLGTLCVCQSQNIRSLNLCTVASNIQMFSGHDIQLAGFLGVGREQAVLYDPKCQNGKPLMYVQFARETTGDIKGLQRILRRKPYAAVIVEGTVRGGAPIKVDPHLPDWLKDRLKDSTDRFGHPGSFDIMIEVERVVSAKDID